MQGPRELLALLRTPAHLWVKCGLPFLESLAQPQVPLGPLSSWVVPALLGSKARGGVIQPAITRGRRECELLDRQDLSVVLGGSSSECGGGPRHVPFGNSGMTPPGSPQLRWDVRTGA